MKKVILLVMLSLFAVGCSANNDDAASDTIVENQASSNQSMNGQVSETHMDNQNESEEQESTDLYGEIYAATKYFQSVANNDLDSFLSAFSDDAVIRVVNRELNTVDLITNFAVNEVFGGLYEIYRAENTANGIRILLQFTPEGWNNPEPMAVYDLTIEDNKITYANLQYAKDTDKAYFENLILNDTALIPYGFAEYLRGVDQNDASILADGFTQNGSVLDVSRLIDGKDAIEKWANNEVLSLNYEVLKIVYTEKGVILFNHISFSPDGSGFYGSYDMHLVDGFIEYADLQYSSSDEMYY